MVPAPTGYLGRWQRCRRARGCVAIPGATDSTYTPAAADIGYALRVVEQASDPGGVGRAARSPVTSPVVSTPNALAVSGATVTGATRGRPVLGFRLTSAGRSGVRTLTLVLPSGLRFTAPSRGRSGRLVVAAAGHAVGVLGARASGGRLTLTLRRPVSAARVSVGSGRLTVSVGLRRALRARRAPRLVLEVDSGSRVRVDRWPSTDRSPLRDRKSVRRQRPCLGSAIRALGSVSPGVIRRWGVVGR